MNGPLYNVNIAGVPEVVVGVAAAMVATVAAAAAAVAAAVAAAGILGVVIGNGSRSQGHDQGMLQI